MKEIIAHIVVAIVGSSALFSFIQFCIARKDGKKDAMKDLMKAISQLQTGVDENKENMGRQNEALKALAQDRIIFLARAFLKQGYIYDDDLSNLKRMADAYHALKGNGDVNVLMDLVEKLPVKVAEKGGKNENIT